MFIFASFDAGAFRNVHVQVEKYLAARCIFCDPKDVLCASVLLYHFRIFERRFGTSKFVVSVSAFKKNVYGCSAD